MLAGFGRKLGVGCNEKLIFSAPRRKKIHLRVEIMKLSFEVSSKLLRDIVKRESRKKVIKPDSLFVIFASIFSFCFGSRNEY